MIGTRSTGFDHIDLDDCRDRGIQVSNVPSYGDNTVAEHVYRVRRKLDPDARDRWIETVRGVGYRFAPPGDAAR